MVPLLGRASRSRQGRRSNRDDGTPSNWRRRRRRPDCRSASCAARPSGSPTSRERSWPTNPSSGSSGSATRRPGTSGRAERPFDGIHVLSFTHAVAGPTVGRTLAEHGADVLCATRPNDFEHEFIYVEANVGIPEHLHRPRQPGRTGASRRSAARYRHRGQQPPAADHWSDGVSTLWNLPNGTRASCTCRSPATGRQARGRGAEAST